MSERDTQSAGPLRGLRSMKTTRKKEGCVTHGFTTDQADDCLNIKIGKDSRNRSFDAVPEMKQEPGKEHDSPDSSDHGEDNRYDVPGTSGTQEKQYSGDSDEESTQILDEMLKENFSEFPEKIASLHKL